MKSFYLLTLAAAIALAACSNDDSTPDPNPSPADTGLVIEQTEYTIDALFDPTFAQVLQTRGIISDAEHITPADMEKMAAITELNISGTYDTPGSLTSLQGIEYFESLSTLNCYSNKLTSLDISRNTALTELNCSYNPGDGVSSFPITACFDNDTKPGDLEIHREQWTYDDSHIFLDFRKAE